MSSVWLRSLEDRIEVEWQWLTAKTQQASNRKREGLSVVWGINWFIMSTVFSGQL
jgi:hypothetical protein